MSEKEVLIEARKIVKTFPGVKALQGVQLTLHEGEVLALVGENGAGKSTFMNILLGSLKMDSGEIFLKGKPYHPQSPAQALEQGISMIHQELTLIPEMTVDENIWLGREQLFEKFGYLDLKKRMKATRKLLDEFGIELKPEANVERLSVAQMQQVELARALSYDADVIIMDEPTSSFTTKEIEQLYKIIRILTERKKGIIFITHKLDEVFTACDTVVVLRDGQYIGTKSTDEVDRDELIGMMVGRQVDNLYPKETAEIGEVVLEVRNLSRKGHFENVNFSVRAGEVVGFCGLIGAGRSEVMECVFGIEKKTAGEIYIRQKKVEIHIPKDAIKYKIAMVTEDRRDKGLMHMQSVEFNMSISYLDEITKAGFVNQKTEDKDCREIAETVQVKMSGLDQSAGQLSGGNQQKVIIARWLLTQPEILILDEPTRGIDIGAKAEIYKLISDMAKQGKAVIVVSSELPELMGVCDRAIVMSKGKITGEVQRSEFDEKRLLSYAFGNM